MVGQRHADVAVRLQKTGDGARQERARQRRRRSDPQRVTLQRTDLVGSSRDPLHADQGALDLLAQRLGFRSGLQAPSHAQEKREPHAFLQVGHQPRDCRLRHVQRLGRAGHGLPPHHGAERLQLTDLHVLDSISECYGLLKKKRLFSSRSNG